MMRSWHRQCAAKRHYRRRGHARQAMRQMQSTPNRDGARLCVYRCPHCGWYHIGHDVKRAA